MPQISDGQTVFYGGQDASKDAQFVNESQFYLGVNVSTENGLLKPRWGLDKKVSLKFPEGGVKSSGGRIKPYKDIFKNGKFQAIAPYSIGSSYYLLLVISGQIFLVNQADFTVQVIELEGGGINSRHPRVNWSAASKYLVIFDYPNFPVIIDGLEARRADPDKCEVPISNIGGFNQNRLIVGNAGNEFTAGDPTGNQATPDAPITFLEYCTPSTGFTGQTFALSTNYNNDPITAIAFLQVADVSTGIGPLLVSTQSAIYSYLTQNPRDTWTAGQFGSVLCYNAGVVGPRAVTNVNSDVWFVSSDGQIRSLAMSRDEQGKWSKTPASKEVQNWLKVSDPSVLPYTFITYFGNKIIAGANPYRTTCKGLDDEMLPDYAHGGFVVIELDNISTLTNDAPPAWAGLWTGCRPMDVCTNNNRLFVISKDGGANEIYEFLPKQTYDTAGATIRYIKSKVQTREYDFKAPFLDKNLQSVEVQLANLRGDFSLNVKYRPDQSANFLPWREFQHDAPWRSCQQPFFFTGLAGQSFKRINLGVPVGITSKCDPVTKVLYQNFERVQLELNMEGIYWEIKGIKINADPAPQVLNITSCKQFATVPVTLACTDDWAIGDFETCLVRQT